MENKKKISEIGVMYLIIHKRLSDSCDILKVLEKKRAISIISRLYHIPKKNQLPFIILKELENKGLVKILGTRRNNKIEVLNPGIDLDKSINALSQIVGLF